MTSADSRLAAASNEIRVRVESSKNRLTTVRPRRVGSFLIGRSGDAGQLLGGVEHEQGVVAGEVGAGQQVALHRRRPVRRTMQRRHRRPSSSASEHPDGLAQRRRQVLADVVGPDRQLAVAAVDQHGELDGPRPAEVVERVEGGPDGAAGEQDVVDEHDDLAVDAAGRDVGGSSARAGRSRRSSRYIVTSREPTGHVDALDRRRSAAASRRASGTPRVGMPSSTRSSAPLVRSRISWAIRVRARVTSAASRTSRSGGSVGRTIGLGLCWHRGRRGHRADLLPRLSGRVVKGCRARSP